MVWSSLSRARTGAGIAYVRRGEGDAVVLLHGVGLRAESWKGQIDALSGDHAVFAPDTPGLGESDPLAGTRASIADYADAIAGFIEQDVGTPALVVGHSMGAMMALDLAVRHPSLVCAVAAVNAIHRRSDAARDAVIARADALAGDAPMDTATAPVRRWFGESPRGDAAAAAEACRQWLLASPRAGYAAAYAAFARGDSPPDALLASLEVPSLFLTGACDGNSTPVMSRRMAALVPDGTVRILEAAGHMAPMTHIDAVNDALATLDRRARRMP